MHVSGDPEQDKSGETYRDGCSELINRDESKDLKALCVTRIETKMANDEREIERYKSHANYYKLATTW